MSKSLNWSLLYFGKVTRSEIKKYVAQGDWQMVRLNLKGSSLSHKYYTLQNWLQVNNYSRAAQVQVTNYVTALSREGLIKPEDYLESSAEKGGEEDGNVHQGND